VLANRLSADPAISVLLLEAGGKDDNWWIHVPIGYAKTFVDPRVNWMFESEPEARLNNRTTYQPRGKVLGGTSSINGMVYMRGNAADYDEWRQRGCDGWDYESVLPYFRKAEDNTWGVLNAREEFAQQNPQIVARVLKVYEEARIWAKANPDALKKALVAETKLPDTVIARQLERTDLTNASITPATTETILQAGLALQKAGVLKPETDVKAVVAALIDTRFAVSAK